jgi:asparagine synthase (glutamine-hydrolysing)
MCGILAVLGYQGDMEALRSRVLELSKRIRHRGPDWNSMELVGGKSYLAHERLAIVDLDNGAQPLKTDDGRLVLTVNGEIYNHKALRANLKQPHKFKTSSDCEVIMYLYDEIGEEMVNKLDGFFAFVLTDKEEFLVARDPIGITTLYQGQGPDGALWFASEMKCLIDVCKEVSVFPPGHVYSSRTGKLRRYFEPSWWHSELEIPRASVDYVRLRETLEKAVVKRLMSDVPYGVLLSGGLDSSLIAAITARHARLRVEEDEKLEAWWPRLHSFSIGLPNAPDLIAAHRVAEFLGTVHHSFCFTVSDGLDALSDVIYHLETYDVTTIRASTPMYLLSRKIKATGVKMVLSGEGSDEIFGGYLYFHQAPSGAELHRECLSRIKALHYADCLRANKSTMAWGVEVRVPFLDKDFLEVAMTIDPDEKLCRGDRIEKYILRKAFDVPENPYLPEDILWRQKEQFSDGVGYSWIDELKAFTETQVSDEAFARAKDTFPDDTPTTKEAYYYRVLFHKHFPQKMCLETIKRWIPRTDWGCSADPSGRVQKAHMAHQV